VEAAYTGVFTGGRRVGLSALVVVLLARFAVRAWSRHSGGSHSTKETVMMFWYGHDMGGWGYALMTIGMVVFWVLVIVGFVVLIRSMTTNPTVGNVPPQAGATPQQILADRYARGEIDDEEYTRRLKVLNSGVTSVGA
jgi:putative membrane protein